MAITISLFLRLWGLLNSHLSAMLWFDLFKPLIMTSSCCALECFITFENESLNYMHSPLWSVPSISERDPDTLFAFLPWLERKLHEAEILSPCFVHWCIPVLEKCLEYNGCSINICCLLDGLILEFLSDINGYHSLIFIFLFVVLCVNFLGHLLYTVEWALPPGDLMNEWCQQCLILNSTA